MDRFSYLRILHLKYLKKGFIGSEKLVSSHAVYIKKQENHMLFKETFEIKLEESSELLQKNLRIKFDCGNVTVALNSYVSRSTQTRTYFRSGDIKKLPVTSHKSRSD